MKIGFVRKIFVVLFVSFLFFNIFSLPVLAAIDFTPQIAIGKFAGKIQIDGNSIGLYITEIYTYFIGIVGILATVVMMIGGVVWITAGGNASRVGEAKAWISGALMGLVLALASFTILNTINPDLVSMKKLNITPIDSVVMGCCEKDGTHLGTLTEDECKKEKEGDEWIVDGVWDKSKCVKNQNLCCDRGTIDNYHFCKEVPPTEECGQNIGLSTWSHHPGFVCGSAGEGKGERCIPK
jgi:hypothetical protein